MRVCFFCLILLLIARSAWSGDLGSDTGEDRPLLEYLKGEATENHFFLGMATWHFNPKSRRIRNWDQKLVGFQYKDFFVATFENSFYNRTWTVGLARNLSTAELSDSWDTTFGYRLGLVYGYSDGEAPFSSISPVIPMVEIYNQYLFKKHYGLELMLTTSISVSFFYQF
ncbi:MAG: hypothetical protein ACD_75C00075G0003 [uncultured bacterium]|nr:MAG: hypothetical protein ACD_75C00075G0003 [uncultured bacterium]HBG19778.1 hypothetical protein [Desulfobulbaceae bacterium]